MLFPSCKKFMSPRKERVNKILKKIVKTNLNKIKQSVYKIAK